MRIEYQDNHPWKVFCEGVEGISISTTWYRVQIIQEDLNDYFMSNGLFIHDIVTNAGRRPGMYPLENSNGTDGNWNVFDVLAQREDGITTIDCDPSLAFSEEELEGDNTFKLSVTRYDPVNHNWRLLVTEDFQFFPKSKKLVKLGG